MQKKTKKKNHLIKETPWFLPSVSSSIVKMCLRWSLHIFLISSYCPKAPLWRREFFPPPASTNILCYKALFSKKLRLNVRFSSYIQSCKKILPFLNNGKFVVMQVCIWNGGIASICHKDFSLLALPPWGLPWSNKLHLRCLQPFTRGNGDRKGSTCSQSRFKKKCRHEETISGGALPANPCRKADE